MCFLQFFVDGGYATSLIICTTLVQVENTLFLSVFFKLTLGFVQLRDKSALRALQLLHNLIIGLNLLASQLLHLLFCDLILDLRVNRFNLACALDLLQQHIVF